MNISAKDVATGFARVLAQVGARAASAALEQVLDEVDQVSTEVQSRTRKAKSKLRKGRKPGPEREDP